MGPRQYRAIRRRPAQGYDLWRVRRRREGLDRARNAVGQGPLSSRGDPERSWNPDARARQCSRGRRPAADGVGTRSRARRRNPERQGGAHCRRTGRGRAQTRTAGSGNAAWLCSGSRRTNPGAAPVRPQGLTSWRGSAGNDRLQSHGNNAIPGWDREAFALDEEGLRRRVKFIFQDRSEQVIEEFRAANPAASRSELFFLIGTESMMGAYSRKIAQRKSEQGPAPAYLYRFEWETPVAEGRLKSPHALEITFVFDHAGEPLAPRLAPDSPEVQKLAAEMSGRWIAFARTGDPNTGNAPHWPAYSAEERATMIFSSKCRVENDPSRQERLA